MIAKAGGLKQYLEQQRKRASVGGIKANESNPNSFKNNPKRASKAGKIGGKVSKRGKPTKVAIEPDLAQV